MCTVIDYLPHVGSQRHRWTLLAAARRESLPPNVLMADSVGSASSATATVCCQAEGVGCDWEGPDEARAAHEEGCAYVAHINECVRSGTIEALIEEMLQHMDDDPDSVSHYCSGLASITYGDEQASCAAWRSSRAASDRAGDPGDRAALLRATSSPSFRTRRSASCITSRCGARGATPRGPSPARRLPRRARGDQLGDVRAPARLAHPGVWEGPGPATRSTASVGTSAASIAEHSLHSRSKLRIAALSR